MGTAGGFGAATIPKTSHSLNKIELRAVNWGRVAMTHFRPGGAVAKSYRQVDQRGNLASDYIVSGAHVIGGAQSRKRDCLLAVMNIEFEDDHTGSPLCKFSALKGSRARKSSAIFRRSHAATCSSPICFPNCRATLRIPSRFACRRRMR